MTQTLRFKYITVSTIQKLVGSYKLYDGAKILLKPLSKQYQDWLKYNLSQT